MTIEFLSLLCYFWFPRKLFEGKFMKNAFETSKMCRNTIEMYAVQFDWPIMYSIPQDIHFNIDENFIIFQNLRYICFEVQKYQYLYNNIDDYPWDTNINLAQNIALHCKINKHDGCFCLLLPFTGCLELDNSLT